MSIGPRLIAAIAGAVLLTSCQVSVGARINKEELQKQVQSELTKSVGEQAPPISCPDDLEAKVGAKTTCQLTDSSGTYDVAVDVTEVNNGTANFHIKVADEPNP